MLARLGDMGVCSLRSAQLHRCTSCDWLLDLSGVRRAAHRYEWGPMSDQEKRIVVRRAPQQMERNSTLRHIQPPEGLGEVDALAAEIESYADVLLGRCEPPIDAGVASLMECADAFYARACEIDMLIHKGERDFTIGKGSPHYKFRTGELRSFLELSKRAAEMGSRRITVALAAIQERR